MKVVKAANQEYELKTYEHNKIKSQKSEMAQ